MGLFAHRPEEPTEWAGLPSEPQRERSEAERLGERATVDLGLTGLLGETAGAIESIVVPVAPVARISEAQNSSEGEETGEEAGEEAGEPAGPPRLEP